MLNQIILVGRLTKEVEIETRENFKIAKINLAIPRSFKNSEGLYDTDFVQCIAFDSIGTNTKEFCKKGDIIGVKGRIQTRTIEKDDENKETITEIIAEKVSFLSSNQNKEDK